LYNAGCDGRKRSRGDSGTDTVSTLSLVSTNPPLSHHHHHRLSPLPPLITTTITPHHHQLPLSHTITANAHHHHCQCSSPPLLVTTATAHLHHHHCHLSPSPSFDTLDNLTTTIVVCRSWNGTRRRWGENSNSNEVSSPATDLVIAMLFNLLTCTVATLYVMYKCTGNRIYHR
jgi:hypothetical protein